MTVTSDQSGAMITINCCDQRSQGLQTRKIGTARAIDPARAVQVNEKEYCNRDRGHHPLAGR
jgi:hypothetical protein